MNEIRNELRSILEAAEQVAHRLRELHARIPIPPGDELMLLGEEEPVFLHIVRIDLECALADRLEPFLGILRELLEERQEPDHGP
jgi:hypothetical protein